ncbi:uncharacterized protein OCT59_008089 [Rhizophagus irregularis]|uniref:uncharacterized protein n=1 Tax=Rhizophagus irregularis TaxID=588596 RepID=UPI00332FB1BD|nr:hypothetical protein OCT59_008089 [Rhizophagus irregularis]
MAVSNSSTINYCLEFSGLGDATTILSANSANSLVFVRPVCLRTDNSRRVDSKYRWSLKLTTLKPSSKSSSLLPS